MGNSALDKIALSAAPFLARGVIRMLRTTMRLKFIGFEGYRKLNAEGSQVIIAFWHSRLLMMPYAYLGKRVSILVSQSKDGELIARTVKGFNVDSVRGSTTRGWVAGIKGLLKAAREGRDLAITPDGPRGPKMKVQMGVIQIARATGAPVVPMSFGASKKKLLPAGIPL